MANDDEEDPNAIDTQRPEEERNKDEYEGDEQEEAQS